MADEDNKRNRISTKVAMVDTLTCNVLLDPVVDSECEDIDFDREDIDSEYEEIDLECEDCDLERKDFDLESGEDINFEDKDISDGYEDTIKELGVVPLLPTSNARDQRPQSPQYSAGCVWTQEDWSCSYDAVFMAFWSLYKQSSPSWRNDWLQRAPEWNIPLGDNFNHLIILTLGTNPSFPVWYIANTLEVNGQCSCDIPIWYIASTFRIF